MATSKFITAALLAASITPVQAEDKASAASFQLAMQDHLRCHAAYSAVAEVTEAAGKPATSEEYTIRSKAEGMAAGAAAVWVMNLSPEGKEALDGFNGKIFIETAKRGTLSDIEMGEGSLAERIDAATKDCTDLSHMLSTQMFLDELKKMQEDK